MSLDTRGRLADPTVIARGRARRTAQRRVRLGLLATGLVALFAIALMAGRTFYGPEEVLRVLLGQTVPGAGFTVGELRLPRAVLGVLAGAALGLAGVTFQTMLRNALASPDVIGVTAGASAAAVVGLVVLGWSAPVVSGLAIVAALATAVLIYGLSWSGGAVADTRMILIGIGLAAMLDSVITYVILRAAVWDVQVVMRWLTGSLNAATWAQVVPLAVAVALLAPVLLAQAGGLALLQHGDDSATALGVPVQRTRLLALLSAVALLAFATAAAGPIAFVAFLAGPIAARVVGGGRLLLASGLVGALLVLGGDLLGQYAFGSRYPVGVVTGALGAPYLIYLLVRTNRAGGSL